MCFLLYPKILLSKISYFFVNEKKNVIESVNSNKGFNQVQKKIHSYMLQMQITGDPIGEVRAVSSMHQRKAEMARQADAFIALPGKILFLITHIYI